MGYCDLAKKDCVPCKGGVPPLQDTVLKELLSELDQGWQIINGHHLEKTYLFGDFLGALGFTNAIGEIAEAQGHHPEIHLAWGRVTLSIWTHKIDGLVESDFILAAKADRAFATMKGPD
jgi:4a-hydroxytetrahydrobiopterin dehydratase